MRVAFLLMCYVASGAIAAPSGPGEIEEDMAVAALLDSLDMESDDQMVNSTEVLQKRLTFGWRQRQAIVDAHNKYRRSVIPKARQMATLSWDSDLAVLAQKWADACEEDHGFPQPDKSNKYGSTYIGQNMYWGSTNGVWATDAWYSEVNFYDRCNNNCMPGKDCGHYTQLVWARTNKVGCGVAQCGSNPMVVCNYLPGGNVNGEPPYDLASPANCERCGNHFCGANGRPSQYYPSCQCKCTKMFTGSDCKTVNCAGIKDNARCKWSFVKAGSDACKVGSLYTFKAGESTIPELCPHKCGHCNGSPKPQPGPKPGPQPGPKPGPKPGPQPGPKPGPQPGPQPGPSCNGASDQWFCQMLSNNFNTWKKYGGYGNVKTVCDPRISMKVNGKAVRASVSCPKMCKTCKRELEEDLPGLLNSLDME